MTTPSTPNSLHRIEARTTILGEGMLIRRALPSRERRMIGAWCFLDHAGPADVSADLGMRVGPHPHIGLQTFTWMIAGEVLHRDSLGYEQIIRPGQVNLMTAGRGISHSEESPATRSPEIHLAQLWIALPDAQRQIAPAFEHYPILPVINRDSFTVTLLVGELFGETSPVKVHSPLLGADFTSTAANSTTIALRTDFEYGVLVLEGEATLATDHQQETVAAGTLLYFHDTSSLTLSTQDATRLLLIGGAPFEEDVLLWWNFVARTQAEIETATRDWNEGHGFGKVANYVGTPLVAPPVPEHIRASRS